MKKQMSFGENLINLRKQKGWSQDDLADNLNLSRQAISKWENNTSKPDIDNIKKISKVFSVGIDDLLNNDVAKDKAVALNVKKEEKKERTITIVKCMIIAVIILYIISVIYKFASLLIIVNGIQKYANLSNYHYVINTYENNVFVQKDEYWFKEGISKNIKTITNEEKTNKIIIEFDFNNNVGTIYDTDNNVQSEINIIEYLEVNQESYIGNQLYYQMPNELKEDNLLKIIWEAISFNDCKIIIKSNSINVVIGEKYIVLDKNTFLPTFFSQEDKKNKNYIVKTFEVELNNVNQI